MTIEGSLDELRLADIVQIIGSQKRSGVLTVDAEQAEAALHFREGEITRVDRARHRRVHATDRPTPHERFERARLDIVESVARLLQLERGVYAFRDRNPMDSIDDGLEKVSMPVDEVMREALRILHDWPVLRSLLPMPSARVRVVRPLAEEPEQAERTDDLAMLRTPIAANGADAGIEPRARRLYPLIERGATISEIIDRSPFGEIETRRALVNLRVAGVIDFEEDAVPPSSSDDLPAIPVTTADVLSEH